MNTTVPAASDKAAVCTLVTSIQIAIIALFAALDDAIAADESLFIAVRRTSVASLLIPIVASFLWVDDTIATVGDQRTELAAPCAIVVTFLPLIHDQVAAVRTEAAQIGAPFRAVTSLIAVDDTVAAARASTVRATGIREPSRVRDSVVTLLTRARQSVATS
ncbi:MAG: hypothetical protein ACJAYU_003417 [Bradymonadia bacterium]